MRNVLINRGQYIVLISLCWYGSGWGWGKTAYNREGRNFVFKPDFKVVLNETTKKQVIDVYGSPYTTLTKGNYQIVVYHIKTDFLSHPSEWKELMFYTDISTGIVKDYFYHDSALNGQDESESLYMKAKAAQKRVIMKTP